MLNESRIVDFLVLLQRSRKVTETDDMMEKVEVLGLIYGSGLTEERAEERDPCGKGPFG